MAVVDGCRKHFLVFGVPMVASSLEQRIELLSKLLTLVAKLGFFIGGVSAVFYFLKIEYFPQDLSIGNGLIFLVIATFLGLVHVFIAFVGFPLAIFIIKHFRQFIKTIKTPKTMKKYILNILPEFVLAIISALLFTYLLLKVYNKVELFYSILLIFLCNLFLCYCYLSFEEETLEKKYKDGPQINQTYSIKEFLGPIVILLLSIYITESFGGFLNTAMQFAQVRIEKAVIYIKEPYSSLLPKSLNSERRSAPKDYIAFENVTIIFRGIGKTTVISFPDGGARRKLEIPNEYLIIENF